MSRRLASCAALALWIGGIAPLARADLLDAAARGDVEAVRRGVVARESLEARDKRGWTALMYAASRGNVEMARVLLEAGADANCRAAEGSTPLIGAAVSGHLAVVQLLVQRGADPTLANTSGATAQVKAKEYGHTSVEAFLAKAVATRQAARTQPAPEPEEPLGPTFDIDELADVYVLVEDTTFRKLPTFGAPAAGQMPTGVAIRVTGKVRGRDWYRVGPASSSVFVPGRAIKPTPKAPDQS